MRRWGTDRGDGGADDRCRGATQWGGGRPEGRCVVAARREVAGERWSMVRWRGVAARDPRGRGGVAAEAADSVERGSGGESLWQRWGPRWPMT